MSRAASLARVHQKCAGSYRNCRRSLRHMQNRPSAVYVSNSFGNGCSSSVGCAAFALGSGLPPQLRTTARTVINLFAAHQNSAAPTAAHTFWSACTNSGEKLFKFGESMSKSAARAPGLLPPLNTGTTTSLKAKSQSDGQSSMAH
jgi:hypothetical protein